ARNDASNKKDYDEFVQKTGLDPLTQINLVVGGFPSDVDTSKEMVVVIKGKFDEKKIIAYAREKSKQSGHPTELKTESYGGKTIYSDEESAQLSFLDSSTLLVGGKTWIRKAID